MITRLYLQFNNDSYDTGEYWYTTYYNIKGLFIYLYICLRIHLTY